MATMAIAMYTSWQSDPSFFLRHRRRFHTRGPLLSVHYAHIKRPALYVVYSAVASKLEDTTKMTAHSKATAHPDLAGDQHTVSTVYCGFDKDTNTPHTEPAVDLQDAACCIVHTGVLYYTRARGGFGRLAHIGTSNVSMSHI
jgi:hypothetical protein